MRARRSSRWTALFGLLTLLLGTSMLTGPPAHAFANASFPTQDLGNRGVDVLAIQHLLNEHGHETPADGVFDEETDAAVREFQSAAGLGVDGIVGPRTWSELLVTLRQGDSGAAVTAVQEQLNAKNAAGLTVSGEFDTATDAAVRDYQRHASIGVDGVVGPVTWRNLLWHYVEPDFDVGICNQDPDGNGDAHWGTAAAVEQLNEAVRLFHDGGDQGGGDHGGDHGEVPLGDISFRHGGPIPAHSSHQVGLDVDLWPIRSDGGQCTDGRITWRSPEYDRAATRELVQALYQAAPDHIGLIFFNDPVLIDEGLTQEWPNHDNHLHIRYCERVHPSSIATYTC